MSGRRNEIIRISPRSGKVLGRIDLTGIIDTRELHGEGAVLNGIAYDAHGDRLFVTGKLWPKLFEHQAAESPVKKGRRVPHPCPTFWGQGGDFDFPKGLQNPHPLRKLRGEGWGNPFPLTSGMI